MHLYTEFDQHAVASPGLRSAIKYQDKSQIENPILIAEDNETDAFILQQAFGHLNMENSIIIFDTGQMLINYLDTLAEDYDDSNDITPQLILLDIYMPEKNGIETLKDIRNHPKFQRLPIGMTSTFADLITVFHAYEQGLDFFFQKPETLTQWIEELEKILKSP